jgi:hypothetical protein
VRRVVVGVTGYVTHCRYFSIVRLLNSVVCGYWCNWICEKLQVFQYSEVIEQCVQWLLLLLYM